MTTSFLINLLHLSVSLFSTYCIFINNHIHFCCYMVATVCGADYIFAVVKWRKMTLDIFVHHFFVFCIIVFYYYHDSQVDKVDVAFLQNGTSTILSLEISSIFLALHHLMTPCTHKIIVEIIKPFNQLCFVVSFSYFRIYQFTYFVLFLLDKNYFLDNMYKSTWNNYLALMGLHGLVCLNFNWFYLILKKVKLLFQEYSENTTIKE